MEHLKTRCSLICSFVLLPAPLARTLNLSSSESSLDTASKLIVNHASSSHQLSLFCLFTHMHSSRYVTFTPALALSHLKRILFFFYQSIARPLPSLVHHKWPEMIDAEQDSGGNAMGFLYRRTVGSYERPKNIWTRAEALRNRLRHARRHLH